MINRKIAPSIIAVIAVAGLVVWLGLRSNTVKAPAPSSTATAAVPSSASPANSSLRKPSGKDLKSLTPEEVEKLVNGGGFGPTSVPYAQLNGPASCQASGDVEFFSPTTARDSAKLTYAGIDSPARQIKWLVTPDDNLGVGPNLAASLKLPDGNHMVTVTLPSPPKARDYTLTVSMTYGRLVNGAVRVYEVGCSGQVKVKLSY